MTVNDWSREIAALSPLVQGRTIELRGATSGMLPNVVVADWASEGGIHDFSGHADGSADTIVVLGGLDEVRDPFHEFFHWRRVLREGGTLALIVDGVAKPQGLLAMLNHLGGFEITTLRPITADNTWLLIGERQAIAEIRYPMGSFGPRLAALANESPAARGELHFQLGAVLLQIGDPQIAKSCFQVMLDLEPENSSGLFGMGMAAGTLGLMAEAKDYLVRAQQVDPQNEDIQRWLSLVETKLGSNSPPVPAASPATFGQPNAAPSPAVAPPPNTTYGRVAIPQPANRPAPRGHLPVSPVPQAAPPPATNPQRAAAETATPRAATIPLRSVASGLRIR